VKSTGGRPRGEIAKGNAQVYVESEDADHKNIHPPRVHINVRKGDHVKAG